MEANFWLVGDTRLDVASQEAQGASTSQTKARVGWCSNERILVPH